MAQPLNITHATTHDIAAIEKLVNSAYRGETSKKGWTTEAALLDGIRIDAESLQHMLHEKNAVILKGTNNEGLVGCVYLQKQGDKLYLGMLTVNPQLQNAGIGKQLLGAAENHARQLGCTSVMMTVISVRNELIDWYKRHGYSQTGETKPFPQNQKFGIPKQPLEFIILEKQITT